MKVKSVCLIKCTGSPIKVADCAVGSGFLKTSHGSLPDIDVDFDAEGREDVKAYLEHRYDKKGLKRVFSAGALTTIKVKSAMKDIGAAYRLSRATVNMLTKPMKDDGITWTGLMRLATEDRAMMSFVQKNPDVFEEMLPLLGQGRSSTIHPSAVVILPEYINNERLNCYEVLPIKRQNDMLVSELDGVDIDTIGILKNDVLAIKELTRLSDILKLIESEYHIHYDILQIITKYLNDQAVFELIKNGYTQGLFQMNNDGMTKFIRRLRPDSIEDLIAAVAIFRPGPLESGAAENYVMAKKGEYEPQYAWGTYEILKSTYGEQIYQEQNSQVARKVGNLSLGDGVNLVKALSKKKVEKVRKFKDKFFEGAKQNGCPEDDAKKIWSDIESSAKYSFNRSHSVSYGLTAYVGAWLKKYYTTAFYTIILRDQADDKMAVLLNEIESVGNTKLLHPDINISGDNFTADFKNNRIYWSLARIKYVGAKAVQYIMQERKLYGNFSDLEDFINRIFKSGFKSFDDEGTEEQRGRCPVTSRVVKQLIFAGAFDTVENISDVTGRYGLLKKAAHLLGFELTDDVVPADMADKHYFWSRMEIVVSGHGSIDYKKIYQEAEKTNSMSVCRYTELKELNNRYFCERRGVICATITSISEKTYKDKKTGETRRFGKIELQQNTDTNILVLWSDEWIPLKDYLKNGVGKTIIATANIKWSEYDDRFALFASSSTSCKLL